MTPNIVCQKNKKKTLNQSVSLPNMETILEKIASCRYTTKMDKWGGLCQVDLMSYTHHSWHSSPLRGGFSSERLYLSA